MTGGETFYVIVNLDDSYKPRGFLTVETNVGSVMLVFRSDAAAMHVLQSRSLDQLIQDGGGPKAVVAVNDTSVDAWFDRMCASDPSMRHVICLPEGTEPHWTSLVGSL